MVAEFSTFPIGGSVSMSGRLTRVMKLVEASGLPYTVGAMGTSIEGIWDQVMPLIRRCHETLRAGNDRVLTHIVIDDRRGAKGRGRLRGKVASLERKLGHPLHRSA